ncbi:MAG: helix-turn-helix transcriptional regulator [Hyphomonadaceae bacterium]|nr:helix-turn-helix transcriptional regulator [Hyphomonadaceae bacterium]
MNATSSRDVTEVDAGIGARIRARRNALKLPLRHVAGLVGVTYQQLQKYESGGNRISAAMLTQIAESLGCDPSDFLPGAPKRRGATAPGHDALAMQLQAAYAKIGSLKERRLILDLTRRLGAAAEKQEKSARPKRRR